jgi:hypothetical protein
MCFDSRSVRSYSPRFPAILDHFYGALARKNKKFIPDLDGDDSLLHTQLKQHVPFEHRSMFQHIRQNDKQDFAPTQVHLRRFPLYSVRIQDNRILDV